MPLISTGTMGSNKSFGFSRGAKKLITFNLPTGTSTWTAPAGVTNLLSAVGKGSNGTAGYWNVANYSFNSWVTGYDQTGGSATTVTWGQLYNNVVSYLSIANAGGSSSRTLNMPSYSVQIYPSNNVDIYNFSTPLTIRGTASIASIGSPPSSGTITYAQVGLYVTKGWYLDGLEYYQSGSDGSATTGFGRTFPGGTMSVPTASNTTFTNVAVTPGTQYTIVNNGTLTITYYT